MSNHDTNDWRKTHELLAKWTPGNDEICLYRNKNKPEIFIMNRKTPQDYKPHYAVEIPQHMMNEIGLSLMDNCSQLESKGLDSFLTPLKKNSEPLDWVTMYPIESWDNGSYVINLKFEVTKGRKLKFFLQKQVGNDNMGRKEGGVEIPKEISEEVGKTLCEYG